jgi:ACS family sodium-dependent inorganic phosphate cotransporter
VETPSTGFWPKRYTLVLLCFAATVVCYLDRVNISVAALAMQERFGWTETTKGLVLSSFFIGYLLFQIPAGHLAARYGGKVVLGAAVLWWSVCTLITPLAAGASLAWLLTARIAMGLGEAATFPASYSLFPRWVPEEERSRAVSLLLSGIPVGTLVGLSLSGFLIDAYGWPSVFYVFGTLGFVWTMLWIVLVHDRPEKAVPVLEKPRVLRELLSRPAIWALIFNHFCNNWSLYVLLTWLPSYFRKVQGLSIAHAGLASAAPWLTMFVLLNVVGWAADRLVRAGVPLIVVRKSAQTIGLLGSAACLLSVIKVTDAAAALWLMCGALGALAFNGSGFAPNHLDIAPQHAAVLMGVTNTVATVPGIVGVAVTGWLVETTGSYSSAFILTAAISVLGAIVWLAFAATTPADRRRS